MSAEERATEPVTGLDRMGATWLRFWFEPADVRPLAAVRILTATLGLLLLWSYAGDLEAWFGQHGMVPFDAADAWRPAWGASLFDHAMTSATLWAFFGGTVAAFVALLLGVATPVAALAAAVLWASLLHRGSMLAGPADDCLAVLLWCLAVGPSGRAWSIDRMLADRLGRPVATTSVAARVSLGLVQVHAAALAVAALLAQLKGDVWWDGTAAWWLASRAGAVDLRPAYAHSEYLMNLVTHAIVAFEILFAIGIWFTATRATIARVALVGWPLIGLLAGEPLWGLAMAIFAVPAALSRSSTCLGSPVA
ncbi:MAG: hypothetical protein ACKOC8_10635 [Pirellulales bacterium]